MGGLFFGLISLYVGNLTVPLALAVVGGLTVVLSLIGALGVDTITDTKIAAGPRVVLKQDRASALVGGLSFGIVFGLAFGLPSGHQLGFISGLVIGLVNVGGFASVWGHLGLARLYLAMRGKQLIHLIAFLEDAHERGVLRQAGAVWEFRHANLQRHLAARR